MSQTGIATEWNEVAEAWGDHIADVDTSKQAVTAAMIAALDVTAGDRLLELGAGPGSLAPIWSRLVARHGRVVVSDIAPAMVAIAADRNRSLDNVQTAVIDAAEIEADDGSFDAVVCRMGLMALPDPPVAIAEIHRVLAPGGRLVTATWGRIEDNPWLTCVGMAAMLSGIVSGGPPVGPGGVFSLSDPSRLAELATAAGFTAVRVDEVALTFRALDVERHVERVIALAPPLAAAFRNATPEQATAARRTAAELAAAFVTDDGLAIPGRALLLVADR